MVEIEIDISEFTGPLLEAATWIHGDCRHCGRENIVIHPVSHYCIAHCHGKYVPMPVPAKADTGPVKERR